MLIACSHILYNIDFNEAYLQFHLARNADITILYKDEKPFPGIVVCQCYAGSRSPTTDG